MVSNSRQGLAPFHAPGALRSADEKAKVKLAAQAEVALDVADRLLDTDPVRADVRSRVLAAAKGRCGVHSSERRIEVDHIIPRSLGGSRDMSALPALCDEGNRGKSNTDQTDFRILLLTRMLETAVR
jgi:HNH endonuclease